MNLSNRVEIAIKIMVTLALAEEGEIISAKSLSDEAPESPYIVLDALRKLRENKLVKSYMGTDGGYTLKRSPEDINLRQVIEAVDGPISEKGCFLGIVKCTNYPKNCIVQKKLRKIQRQWLDGLEEINFENIFETPNMNPIPDCLEMDEIFDSNS